MERFPPLVVIPGVGHRAKRAAWITVCALGSVAVAPPAYALQSTPTTDQFTLSPDQSAAPIDLAALSVDQSALPADQSAVPADQTAVPVSASQPSTTVVGQNLRANEDPTILKSRAWLEGEWNNDQNGASSFEGTLGLRFGFRISDNNDWGVQIEIPYRRITSNDASGNVDRTGLFDIKWNIGTAFRLSPTVRIGAGIELRTPNGDNDVSLNIWRMQEYVTVAWDATPWLTFTPKLRYYHTVQTQGDATPQRYWEIYLPATFILPHRWSLTPRYEIKIDEIADHTTHSARLALAYQLASPALNFSVAVKVPFNSLTNDYQITLNTTWFF